MSEKKYRFGFDIFFFSSVHKNGCWLCFISPCIFLVFLLNPETRASEPRQQPLNLLGTWAFRVFVLWKI